MGSRTKRRSRCFLQGSWPVRLAAKSPALSRDRSRLFATRSYLNIAATPADPVELALHRCVGWDVWKLTKARRSWPRHEHPNFAVVDGSRSRDRVTHHLVQRAPREIRAKYWRRFADSIFKRDCCFRSALVSDQQGAYKCTSKCQHADPGSYPVVVKPFVSSTCPVGRRISGSPLYNFVVDGYFPPGGHDDHR